MVSESLPSSCDVLVIGAGPAGSACARLLAEAGRQVLLVDQHDFPRDKICGDGLIPDAHAALRRLGVYEEVAAQAIHVPQVRCIGPRGGHIDVPGHIAVLPRKTLDDVLVRHAQAAGARLLTPLRFEAPLLDGERVVGARFRHLSAPHEAGSEHQIQARWVVLATGAVPQALTAAGVCDRHTPSGVALRGYLRLPELRQRVRQLHLVWHPRLRGGYGWIFPLPGGSFNIGVGLTGAYSLREGHHGYKQGGNLRQMLQAFGEIYAPAGELLTHGQALGEFKGAPLRCSLAGARWSRPGLLVTGEAAGSTYAFTGEGIGKAMETGMLTAEALVQGWQAQDDTAIARQHEASLAGLKPRFALYETAHRVNLYPWIADLVIWRARRSELIQRKLAGLLDETSNPGQLFSVRGMKRIMFG